MAVSRCGSTLVIVLGSMYSGYPTTPFCLKMRTSTFNDEIVLKCNNSALSRAKDRSYQADHTYGIVQACFSNGKAQTAGSPLEFWTAISYARIRCSRSSLHCQFPRTCTSIYSVSKVMFAIADMGLSVSRFAGFIIDLLPALYRYSSRSSVDWPSLLLGPFKTR